MGYSVPGIYLSEVSQSKLTHIFNARRKFPCNHTTSVIEQPGARDENVYNFELFLRTLTYP